MGAFHTEFPDAGHVSIGIDTGDLDESSRAAFEAAGLAVDVATVLTARSLTAPRDVEAEVRPLASDEDWEARARLSLALGHSTDEDSHLTFARRRNEQEKALVAAGRGARFGAFADGELVSTAAAFRAGEDLARFQTVETHPDHRRRGRAAAVVHAAGRHALEHLGATTLVIVADTDGDAIRVYRGLGFVDVERQVMLEKRADGWAAPTER